MSDDVRATPDAEARHGFQTRTLMRLSASKAFEQGELSTAVRELSEAAADALDVDRVSVWVFAEDDSRLLGLDAFERATRRHEPLHDISSAEFPTYFRALYEHRTIASEDANTDPRTREFRDGYFARHGIRSTLDAPVRLGERVLGVVCHEMTRASRVWTREDEQFAASIGELASLAIEAARLSEVRLDLTRKNRELGILQRMFEVALTTTDVDAALAAIAREIASAFELSHAAIEIFDEQSQTLRRRAAVGWSVSVEPAGTPLDAALGGACVRALKPIVLAGEELRRSPSPELAGLGTFVAVPLRLGGRVLGVLAFGRTDVLEIDATRLAFATRLADALATQVDRYRSLEETRRLEQRLREAQKLEALGTLAGGIAHDFNNLLTGILGSAQALKQSATPGDNAYRAIEVIVSAAERAAELTQQLLGFARQGKQRNVACDVHALIREVCALCSHTMPKSISVEQELTARSSVVLGDPGQLHQTLLNLALNARDAMPSGGRLVFATRDVTPELVPERAGRERVLAPHLLIEVRDTGTGIAPEHVSRVFEPFFTTKGPGKGSGMGLAMVYGIVDAHGGSIEVASELGHGTTLRIYLPVALDTPAMPTPRAPSAPVRGSGHVLVVDDDHLVAQVVAEIVRGFGYSVTVASSGAEAIERYIQARPPFDLVLLDLVMPRMGGRECLRALRRIDPSARIVVSSGWQSSGVLQDVLADGALDFVRKPYEPAQLSDVIARAIAAKPAGG